MKKIPFALIGTGNFSLQRLKILSESNLFDPVAIIDIDIENAKKKILEHYPKLKNKIYKTISIALKEVKFEACFIFASTKVHTDLSIESLENGLHTYCVKSISLNQSEFKKFIKTRNKFKNLVFLQGYNNQWNQAALKMIEIAKTSLGELLGGECLCWGRQSLKRENPQDDVLYEGMFFHTLACHQLCQLVACFDLPEYVTAYTMNRVDKDLDFRGIEGTTSGQAIFEYKNKAPFSYTGIRAGHGNPFGFASRWSGRWLFHGSESDLQREGGKITLYKNGGSIKDFYLKDLDEGLIDDELFQINLFYNDIVNKNYNSETQKKSIDTWILMEACNHSARLGKKININEFKKELIK